MHLFKAYARSATTDITMFITAVCFMFLIKLRWLKTKSLHELTLQRGIPGILVYL